MRPGSLLPFLYVILGLRSEDLCWSRFGDYQYKVLTPSGGALFSDAVEECLNVNTTLASIHSPEENAFLEDFVMSQMSLPLWIGLRREGDDLEWMDGTAVDFVPSNYKQKTTTRGIFVLAQEYKLTEYLAPKGLRGQKFWLRSMPQVSEGCVYIFMGWSEESCKSAALHFICKRKVSDDDACPTTTQFIPTTHTPSTTTQDQPSKTTQKTSTNNAVSSVTSPDEDRSSILTNDIVTSTASESSSTSSSTNIGVVTSENIVTSSTEQEMTFEEMLEAMTVKKKPVFEAIEGTHSKAIGSLSIMILIGIVLGILLLDLNTIKNHLKMLKNNTKDVCKRSNKTDITYLERPKMIKVKTMAE